VKRILQIKERRDPHAIAMKYIITELGMNLRVVDEISNTKNVAKFSLQATVPIKCPTCGIIRKYETIENIGAIWVDVRKKKVVLAPSENEVEEKIEEEFERRQLGAPRQ